MFLILSGIYVESVPTRSIKRGSVNFFMAIS